MRSIDINIKNVFILIVFLSMLVPKVHATCVPIEFDEEWYLESLCEDFGVDKGNGKGKNKYKYGNKGLYQIKFNVDSSLSNLGTGIVSRSHEINAIHQLDNENFVLSSYSKVTVGGNEYDSGDLIKYNIKTGESELYFSGELFDKKENIDAVYIRDNGNIVLSTQNNAELGGVKFKKRDIVEYDPINDQLSILVDGGVLGNKANIQALHILDDGDIIFSVYGSVKIDDMKVGKGDLLRFNAFDGVTYIGHDFDKGNGDCEINAFTTVVPEPATIMFFVAGGLALFNRRRQNK